MGRISLIRLIKQGLNLHLISGTFVHDRTPSRRQQIPKTRCANARTHHNRKAQAMSLAVLRPDTFPITPGIVKSKFTYNRLTSRVLMLICNRRLRVAIATEVKVVAMLALVASPNDGLLASITQVQRLTALRTSIEDLKPSLLLVLEIPGGPTFSDWRVLLVTLVVEVVVNPRGWALCR